MALMSSLYSEIRQNAMCVAFVERTLDQKSQSRCGQEGNSPAWTQVLKACSMRYHGVTASSILRPEHGTRRTDGR